MAIEYRSPENDINIISNIPRVDFLARFWYYYTRVGVWLSWLEHRVWDAGVVGSSPTTPTIDF